MNQNSKQMQHKEIDKVNYAARAEKTEAAEKVKGKRWYHDLRKGMHITAESFYLVLMQLFLRVIFKTFLLRSLTELFVKLSCLIVTL